MANPSASATFCGDPYRRHAAMKSSSETFCTKAPKWPEMLAAY
jgi:hypothetical protein